MSVYTVLWIGWGLYFAVVEGIALFNSKPGDTLSEHIWAWFGTAKAGKPVNGWARFRRFALLAFMAWLTLHFMTGGRV
ncbi:hypothetical protein AB0H43_02900 [Hamadaea sp. NPDC050747]|uniref:hypothetical protein n=1 Tax=Hamadaea sp. NPDC050747 TaxID=3155789 RepID=UPI0033FC7252